MPKCKHCGRSFKAEYVYDDDSFESEGYVQDKLCPDCFEGTLEEYEISKRERIARSNEY